MNMYTEEQVQQLLMSTLLGYTLSFENTETFTVRDVTLELVEHNLVHVTIQTDEGNNPYSAVFLTGPTIRKHDYMQEVLRTYAGNGTQMDKFTRGALGLAGESGEVVDMVKKMLYQGHRLEMLKLLEELGDVLWYIALMCDALEVTLDDAIGLNVRKLHRRYPNGFEVERSVNR